MDRVRFFTYRGNEILLIDLAELAGRQILDVLGAAAEVIRSRPKGSVLTLTDGTTTRFVLQTSDGAYDRVVAEGIRSYTTGNAPYVKAGAIVVGDDENKRVIAGFINRLSERAFAVFDTVEEAKNWLCEQ